MEENFAGREHSLKVEIVNCVLHVDRSGCYLKCVYWIKLGNMEVTGDYCKISFSARLELVS